MSAPLPTLHAAGPWPDALDAATRARLEEIFPGYLTLRRWYRGKSRRLTSVVLEEAFPLRLSNEPIALTVSRCAYADGGTDRYVLPLACASGEERDRIRKDTPQFAVALTGEKEPRLLYDALGNKRLLPALLALFGGGGQRIEAGTSALRFEPFAAFEDPPAKSIVPRLLTAEQTNTSILYGDAFILKVFRQLDEGTSADLEMSAFLTNHGYASAPKVAGAIAIERHGFEPSTLGILHRFVPNRGDAWAFTLGELDAYLNRVAPLARAPERVLRDTCTRVHQLGRRIAEMHLSLASGKESAFLPEPLPAATRRALVDATHAALSSALAIARPLAPRLSHHGKHVLEQVAAEESLIRQRIAAFATDEAELTMTRVHGDLHLGQILFTGEDFVVVDFEGETGQSPAERKAKQSPLADVAGMLRSFHYAAVTALRNHPGIVEAPVWARAWHREVTQTFLDAYVEAMNGSPVLPRREAALRTALDFYCFEKCIYEVAYEANNRPDWIEIPLDGLANLLGLLAKDSPS